ncbi:hypothetical protein PAAG_06833 [Paracoccidioides lutzii Pb01]|uniref:Uncharacterized protein n=1 Tax=Paracoccidioides lutzii (strain ATCC MYA-826 / Pb01) TaxID=502779 RepID=C1H7U2_PARBA|nr:hypothetical protein PAAG_06833 [Paracoccidioides lutzii Pb01]EEH36415.2 hypothetical protein PAAG_06833 [Paracoccidioides lutzii Pb01]
MAGFAYHGIRKGWPTMWNIADEKLSLRIRIAWHCTTGLAASAQDIRAFPAPLLRKVKMHTVEFKHPNITVGGITRCEVQLHRLPEGIWAWESQILYHIPKSSMVLLYVRLASNPTQMKCLQQTSYARLSRSCEAQRSRLCASIYWVSIISTPRSTLWPIYCSQFFPIPILKTIQITHRRKTTHLNFSWRVPLQVVRYLFFPKAEEEPFLPLLRLNNEIKMKNQKQHNSRHSSAEELCTSLEVFVSTICASVPTMRSIIKMHMGGSGADRGPSYEADKNSDSNRGQALTLNNGWRKTTARPQ